MELTCKKPQVCDSYIRLDATFLHAIYAATRTLFTNSLLHEFAFNLSKLFALILRSLGKACTRSSLIWVYRAANVVTIEYNLSSTML